MPKLKFFIASAAFPFVASICGRAKLELQNRLLLALIAIGTYAMRRFSAGWVRRFAYRGLRERDFPMPAIGAAGVMSAVGNLAPRCIGRDATETLCTA